MTTAELVALFRSESAEGEAAIRAGLSQLPALEVRDVLRLLEVLTSKTLARESEAHHARCQLFARVGEAQRDPSLFVPYVRALKVPDLFLRAALVSLIPLVNRAEQHAELCVLLRSEDVDLRIVAAQLLKRVGSRTAFEILTDLMTEARFAGRMEAMDVLCSMAPHHAIPALRSALELGSMTEKVRALDYLASPGCLAKERALSLEAIARAFFDRDDPVTVRAIAAFAAHADEEEYFAAIDPVFGHPSREVVRAAIMGYGRFPTPRVVDRLRQLLRIGPNYVRFAVIEAVEMLGSQEALAPLSQALGHKHVAVRTRAGEALVRLARGGKVELAQTVLWLLRSWDVNIRRMAVTAAQAVPDPHGQLWPKLLDYLYDDDWWVRERVIDALIDMAGEQLVPHLVGYLAEGDAVHRYYAAEVCRRLRSPDALGALIRTATADEDWLVRERAVEAVAALKDERSVPHLVSLMTAEPEMRMVCLEGLTAIGSPTAAPHVAALLAIDELDVDTRLAVLRSLRQLDDPGQAHAVRHQLKCSDAAVRDLATELLGRWQVAKATDSGRFVLPQGTLLDQLLLALAERGGDDLILASGRKPAIKRMGQIEMLAKNVLSGDQVRAMLQPHLSAKQLRDLDELSDVDFSYAIASPPLRFRVNVFRQASGLSAVFRIVKDALPQLGELGLPPVVQSLADLKNGLVLVGGPTGAGKSTTLAALIHHVNATRSRHIVTFEDPIEVVHRRQKSLVNQREIGTHTTSLPDALRATLRQDPDVILVGEMRDRSTIQFGVTAAETGHLVFGTVHIVSAAGAIDRLINACPGDQQDNMRSMLAGSLRAVVCQYLHSRKDGSGRCLSVEVLLNNEAVANLIRKGKTYQIPSIMATSREQGMQLMDWDLMRLLREGLISAEDAYLRAESKKDFERFLTEVPAPAEETPAAVPAAARR